MKLLRYPHTAREKRLSFAVRDWEDEYGCVHIRGCRRAHMLPDSFDDIWRRPQKSWKKKRKTQYRDPCRGPQHEITIGTDSIRPPCRRYEEYFEEHDIPYFIETIRNVRIKTSWWRELPFRYSSIVGYRIVWWSTKDIGIDFISPGTYLRPFQEWDVYL